MAEDDTVNTPTPARYIQVDIVKCISQMDSWILFSIED